MHTPKTHRSIAIFGAKTYPPKIGGIETHVAKLSTTLLKEKYKNYLFVCGERGNIMEKKNNLVIIKIKCFKNRYLLKISMVLPAIRILRKMKNDINIYHAHDSVFGFILSVFGYRPLVYTAHGCAFLRYDWPKPIGFLLKFMEWVTFKKADVIICVDSQTCTTIKRYRRNKKVINIPNGIAVEEYKNLPKPKEYPENKIVIFSAGRLIPSKGFQDLIGAYKSLGEDIKSKTELFIAGTGPYLERLKKMASSDKNIHILGYVEDIKPYFAYADIFVLPSHYEGFPFTLLEAMASNTASIITDIGDLKKRFKSGKELIIVEPRDINAMAEALKTLIKNKDLRNKIKQRALNKVQREYSWDNIAQRTISIYRELLSNQR